MSHQRASSATTILNTPLHISTPTHWRSSSDTASILASMTLLSTDDEPYVGGHYDALKSIGISFLGPDGSLSTGNASHEENKAVRHHLTQVFGATTQFFCGPWVVLGCTPSVPPGRLPEFVGGLIAIWRHADNMDFDPRIGELGQGEEEMEVDTSILEGFQSDQIPPKEAVTRLIASIFPTCIAITYVAGSIIVELPESEDAVFQEALEDMPLIIAGAPFTLEYHNGPLAKVERGRRTTRPRPELAEEKRVADETDYFAKDGQFYPGVMLSSVDKQGKTYSSTSAGVLVQKGDQQRLIVSWHCWEEHDKKYPGLIKEDNDEARRAFRIVQGEGGTEVGRVSERIGETDVALAKLHPGVKFENRFMDIKADAKTFILSDQVKYRDQVLFDSFTTGKQKLLLLGWRFERQRDEGGPHPRLIEKRQNGQGEMVNVVLPRDEVVYIAGSQGVYGTSDNIQTKRPYIRDRACGSVLVRCFAVGKQHLRISEMLDLGEVCGLFHFVDLTSKFAASAKGYLIYADAFDPLVADGWTIVPPQE